MPKVSLGYAGNSLVRTLSPKEERRRGGEGRGRRGGSVYKALEFRAPETVPMWYYYDLPLKDPSLTMCFD